MFNDKVFESTTTTGTGTYALGGAPTGFITFVTGIGDAKPGFYWAQNADGSIWEAGWGQVAAGAPDTITRNFLASSTGSLINWAAGTKYVYSVPLGIILAALLRGILATTRPGWLQSGGSWINNTGTPWLRNLYDGVSDILVERIDTALHAVDRIAYSADAGAGEGPLVELFRDSASPAVSDLLGALSFTGRSSTAVKRTLAKILPQLLDPTNASEDVELLLQTIVAGTLATRAVLGQGLRVGSAADPGAGKIAAESDYLLGAKSLASAEYALTDAATIAWDMALGPSTRVTLGGNRTLGAPTNAIAGQAYHLRVIQDGTGGRTLAYNAVFKWPGGVAPTVASGIGDVSLLVFYFDGTNFLGGAGLDFS